MVWILSPLQRNSRLDISAAPGCLYEGMVEEESPKGRRCKRNNSLEADETILLDTTSVLGRINAPNEYIR